MAESNQTFVIKQNDTRPKLVAVLYDNFGTILQAPMDLTTAQTVAFVMRESDQKDPASPKVKGWCVIVDAAVGVVEYTWEEGDTDGKGIFNAEFEITWEDGGIETVPNKGYFSIEITDDLG